MKTRSKSIVLKLTPSTVGFVQRFNVPLRILGSAKEHSELQLAQDFLFKPGEKVVVSWTGKYIRGYAMRDTGKTFAGERHTREGSCLFMACASAVAHGTPTEWIHQSSHHVALERLLRIGENTVTQEWCCVTTGLPYVTLVQRADHPEDFMFSPPTGKELYDLNQAWKARWGGMLHYKGELIKARYPVQWKQAASIAKASMAMA